MNSLPEAHTLASQLLAELDRVESHGDIHADRRMAEAEWEKARREASAARRGLMELRTTKLLNAEARYKHRLLKLSQASDTLQRIVAAERKTRPPRADLVAQAKRLGIRGRSRMRVNDLVDAIDAGAGNEAPSVAAGVAFRPSATALLGSLARINLEPPNPTTLPLESRMSLASGRP